MKNHWGVLKMQNKPLESFRERLCSFAKWSNNIEGDEVISYSLQKSSKKGDKDWKYQTINLLRIQDVKDIRTLCDKVLEKHYEKGD